LHRGEADRGYFFVATEHQGVRLADSGVRLLEHAAELDSTLT